MIFRSNAVLVAIILLELALAVALTQFALNLQQPSPQPLDDSSKLAQSSQSAPDDYILLVAASYRNDHDIALARERLALFQDDDIAARVRQLALTYSAQGKRQASDLAILAVALGSQDPSLSQIAVGTGGALGSTPSPTLISTIAPSPATVAPSPILLRLATLTRIPPSPTRKPTATSTRTATATTTATATRTVSPAPSATPTQAVSTPTSTAVPSLTPTQASTSSSSASVGTAWQPDRSQWPAGAGYQPANPAPGQSYWHLEKAIYCDYQEQNYGCPSLPGGPFGWGTYVMLIDSQGNRAEAPLLFNGSASGQEQKSATDMCGCNYSFSDSNVSIQIGGAASDTVWGLDPLYSVKVGLSHYHVRYFLTFRLLTK